MNNPWLVTILGGAFAALLAVGILFFLKVIRDKTSIKIIIKSDSSKMNKDRNNTLTFVQWLSITLHNESSKAISDLKLSRAHNWVKVDNFDYNQTPPVTTAL